MRRFAGGMVGERSRQPMNVEESNNRTGSVVGRREVGAPRWRGRRMNKRQKRGVTRLRWQGNAVGYGSAVARNVEGNSVERQVYRVKRQSL